METMTTLTQVDDGEKVCYTDNVDLEQRLTKLEQEVAALKRNRSNYYLMQRQSLLQVVRWIEREENLKTK